MRIRAALIWTVLGGLFGTLALQAQIVISHRLQNNCFLCGTTMHQSPTDPSERCLIAGDGQEGDGTSCDEYYVGDGWVCTTSGNPCYNVTVHGSLQGGGRQLER